MNRFIGIDGGATRATAVVTDARGAEAVRLHGAAALVDPGDPGAGAAALAELARRALSECGAEPPAAVLCCALAGAGREAERAAVESALGTSGVACRVVVTTDAEAALWDAFGNGAGLLLVAGTGSIAWGRAPDGRGARAGGWGERLGDEGSGYALGLAMLRAAVRVHDGRAHNGRRDNGRGVASTLLEHALRETGAASADGLVGWAAAASKADVAALAPSVFAAAAAGDFLAQRLVREAAGDLAAHVVALHRRLGPWPEPPMLALAGGLLAPGRPLRDAVTAAVSALEIDVRILDHPVDAARGAAALARAHASD